MSRPTTLARSDEEQSLRTNMRSLLRTHAPSSELRRLRDSVDGPGHDPGLWARLTELGYASLIFPEALGGSAAGMSPLGEIARELGRALSNTPLISHVLAVTCLETGSEPSHRTLARQAVAGTHAVALAFDAGRRDRPARVVATRGADDRIHLSGKVEHVLDGSSADSLVVASFLHADPGKLVLVVVPANSPGMRCTSGRLLDGRSVSTVDFDDVVIDDNAIIAHGQPADLALDGAVCRGVVLVAAEMVGGAEAALELTIRHLKNRRQFGVPIGSFQALQHRAARMLVAVEMADALLRAALYALDTDSDDAGIVVSSAKVYCDEAFRLVAAEGVQMHGGLGMTDEADIGLYLKRARVTSVLLGDRTFHCDRVAAANGL